MSEHTPGSWQLREYKWGWVIAPKAEPNCLIATAKYDSDVSRRTIERQQADARLVESAPELLETLSDLIAVVETYDDAWNPETDLWDTRRLASEAEHKARGMESIHD